MAIRKVVFFVLVCALMAAPVFAGEISPSLQEILIAYGDDEFVPVHIEMVDQVDIDYLGAELSRINATRAMRNYEVITAAQEMANQTQPPVLDYLENLKIEGKVEYYEGLWIYNYISASVQKSALQDIADLPQVAVIWEIPLVELVAPVRIEPVPELRTPNGAEINLRAINADRVWYELGLTGEGRLVSNVDTGVNVNHPALTDRWRGNEHPEEECWYGPNSTPNDQNGHGTHTMGIICGRQPSNNDTIGVAPDAHWIAAATVGIQGYDPGPAFQWLANPDGDNETIDDVPDVANNSWGYVNQQGDSYCSMGYTLYGAMNMMENAGVVCVWSAGNNGPGSETIGAPASRITNRYNAFAVGATARTYPFAIAYFSSRGPSDCSGPDSLQVKPEVSAPGVGIRSAYFSTYTLMDGTSQAAPHVAGVIALMRQKNPNVTVDEMKQILMDTALDRGGAGEDNTYGWGVIDAYEAVMAVPDPGGIDGTVVDTDTQEPLADVRVYADGEDYETYTDVDGFYHLAVPPGEYYIGGELFGYEDFMSESAVTVDGSDVVIFDFEMTPVAGMGTISGTVSDIQGNSIEGATVSVLNYPIEPALTDVNGMYVLTVPGGYNYDLMAEAPNFGTQSVSNVSVPVDGEVTIDFTLLAVESFEENDGDFYPSDPNRAEWEWGEPTGDGSPEDAYSGMYVWGTDLDGDYNPSARGSLFSPSYTLAAGQPSYELNFYHWYSIDDTWDGGNVQISIDGGDNWDIIHPEGDYPDQSIPALGGSPGYAGISGGDDNPVWVAAHFDLSEYEGQDVSFRFLFAATNNSDPGWFIDHLVVVGASAGQGGDDYTVSGTIHYGLSDDNIPNAELTLGEHTTTSDANGTYSFAQVAGGDYTLIPAKEDDVNGISAFDAARVAQYAADVYDLTEYQLLAADVTGNGDVGAFDAARIAQFSAGVPHGSLCGTWMFIPDMYEYMPLNADMLDQDFDALLYGEVTGNWSTSVMMAKNNTTPQVRATTVQYDGSVLQTPITEDIIAFQFILESNNVISASLAPSVPADWNLIINQQDDNRWYVGAYGVTALTQPELVIIDGNAEVVSGLVNETTITIEKVANTTATPQAYTLLQNSPNPFNPQTTITYRLPVTSDVSVSIYDVAGRLIQSWTYQGQAAGQYNVVWNGTDLNGQTVPSGVYVYRLEANDFNQNRQMILLK